MAHSNPADRQDSWDNSWNGCRPLLWVIVRFSLGRRTHCTVGKGWSIWGWTTAGKSSSARGRTLTSWKARWKGTLLLDWWSSFRGAFVLPLPIVSFLRFLKFGILNPSKLALFTFFLESNWLWSRWSFARHCFVYNNWPPSLDAAPRWDHRPFRFPGTSRAPLWWNCFPSVPCCCQCS